MQAIKKWEPDDFKLQETSIWSFPVRGAWATHDAAYPGNWSPYVPRNIILRYSKEKELLLDQFAGGGTTLVEAKLLNRDIIGVDVNSNALKISASKCNFFRENCGKVYLKSGDAQKLTFIPNESIDLICTHPPYADIIKYSVDIANDISRMPVSAFISAMENVAKESYRVLKSNKYCAILIGDVRQKGMVVPLGFKVMEVFQRAGFLLKEIVLKEQHNCHSTGEWISKSRRSNFLLLAHEYLFVFRK